MALEYRLSLAGPLSVEHVTQRAFGPEARRVAVEEGRGFGGFWDEQGFEVYVRHDPALYEDAEGDGSQWEWEPGPGVDLTFRLDKARTEVAVPAVAQAVARVLASGPEDAAFVQDSDYLLLTRLDGVLRKYRREWWDAYGADAIIPG